MNTRLSLSLGILLQVFLGSSGVLAQVQPPLKSPASIPFEWSCNFQKPNGEKFEISGIFEANARKEDGIGYVRAKAIIKSDALSLLNTEEYVYKERSSNGLNGDFSIFSTKPGTLSHLVNFKFYGHQFPGTSEIIESGGPEYATRPLAIGYCEQISLNASGKN